MSGNGAESLVGLGLIGMLFLLSVLSFLSPTAATIGLIFFTPLLLLYTMVHFSPKIKEMLKPDRPTGPPFDFPNHSATYNVSESSNDDDKTQYNSGVKDDSDFTSNSSSSEQNPRHLNRSIQDAENDLDIRHPYTEDDLNEAYREKVQIHHPDKEDGTKQEFKEIQDAYELLSEEETYTETVEEAKSE
jgi:hypothetical protein